MPLPDIVPPVHSTGAVAVSVPAPLRVPVNCRFPPPLNVTAGPVTVAVPAMLMVPGPARVVPAASVVPEPPNVKAAPEAT